MKSGTVIFSKSSGVFQVQDTVKQSSDVFRVTWTSYAGQLQSTVLPRTIIEKFTKIPHSYWTELHELL